MSHVRQQIREAVAGRVDDINDFGTTVKRVWTDRVHPETTLPAARVLISEEVDGEDLVMLGGGNYKQRRRAMVDIKIYAAAKASIDDTLDGLCVKVEEAIMADDTLGGLVVGMLYQRTTIELDGEREKPVGIATITYAADYYVINNEPETAIV